MDQAWLATRLARSASASVHTAIPSSATSLIRNWPVIDSSGNPPAAASPIPGVVNRKLMVARNNPTAITLPTADSFGHHGLTASSTAVPTSTTPSSVENVVTRERLVNPTHEPTV